MPVALLAPPAPERAGMVVGGQEVGVCCGDSLQAVGRSCRVCGAEVVPRREGLEAEVAACAQALAAAELEERRRGPSANRRDLVEIRRRMLHEARRQLGAFHRREGAVREVGRCCGEIDQEVGRTGSSGGHSS